MTVAAGELGRGMAVLGPYRSDGEGALSAAAACMLKLLEAIEWDGKPRHLAEAVPHFIDNLDMADVRATLANVQLRTFAVECPEGRLPDGALPCLYEPTGGAPLVVFGREDGALRVFDGATQEVASRHSRLPPGTAFVVKPTEQAAGGRPSRSWGSRITARFRTALLYLLLLTFVFNLLSLATPLFMKALYDTVIPSQSTLQLAYLVAGVAIALTMETVFRRLRSLVLDSLAGRVDYLVGRAAFERVMMLPLTRLENEPLGRQVSQLQSFEAIREVFAGALGEALLDLPFLVLFLAAIAILGGWLVLVPVVAALVFVAAITVVLSGSREGDGAEKSRQSRFLVETLSGMHAIKFAGAETVWNERYRDLAAATAMRDFRNAMAQNANLVFSRLVSTCAAVAMMGFGALAVIDQTMTVGALIACTALLWRALTPMQSAYMAGNRIPQVLGSLRQLGMLMRLPAEREPGQVPASRVLKGKIALKGVAHRFSADTDAALSGVSLAVEPGEIVAITGPNGAGKSTLLNLVAGLYRPSLGAILIDGVDIRQLDTIDLRQSIAVMPQTLELMYGTVAQNMRLADPTASDADIEASARMAHIHDDIVALPSGYDTRLTESVLSELTEGFKQRLALARAYLRKAPIVLLDEPGHALDDIGDKALIAALQQLRKRATILIVTHRPSHIQIADRVLMLDRGRPAYVGDAAGFFEHINGKAA
ncbi:MAG: ATP-binding cassette domain-containing protein [Alphaproteobacteria bacterium]